MKRFFDFILSLFALIILVVPIFLITIAVKLTSKGPALYWSNRIGMNNMPFKMPKFRSMHEGTPIVATHLLLNSSKYLTPVGNFLRKSSLDELPQLWSIIVGDMSLVGPRPALFNQFDLIELRTGKNVHRIRPGLTGLAQISGRDKLLITAKVDYDAYYAKNISIIFDIKILILTTINVVKRVGVLY
ncbi:sugar transferase [Candidatus Pseudomonas adelgestsugas]|uniref:Undecaprenyl phosphate N,N'-diacetylbacillosamine 1-phosphate transferase n=1 Tax=Candidatus Pseudomonas adelgestsugas TaxID=1302376 RepID=A0ABX5R8N9_9PSED|nr:sugar transferase [Candidatus Pseudomonas adelgestsugas]QAX82010.1 Undecaprenyl phosphate N,N'-diacetylbacillosamine 1-phosphate transferase [Candidatus Pseudomonas adelgestsugas]